LVNFHACLPLAMTLYISCAPIRRKSGAVVEFATIRKQP
jgi:hypothetical protein